MVLHVACTYNAKIHIRMPKNPKKIRVLKHVLRTQECHARKAKIAKSP